MYTNFAVSIYVRLQWAVITASEQSHFSVPVTDSQLLKLA